MFIIGEAVVDEAVLQASFCCDIVRCKGACCCIEGGRGAPLEDSEILEIKKAFPSVKQHLPERSLRVIEDVGLFEGTPGDYATPCVERRECVFASFENGVALCSFEKAYERGETRWRKPMSCHLFPIRIRKVETDTIQYEQIDECAPGRERGLLQSVRLHEFLREPLVRKYGEAWYTELLATLDRKRQAASGTDSVV
jgi:hypothetical protein